MTQSIIINLSALAEPILGSSIPARVLSCFDDNLARQWPSIEAFADLHVCYSPSTSHIESLMNCGMFGIPVCSIKWVINKIDWKIITEYKSGKINTADFITKFLNTTFSFLKDAEFSKKIIENLYNDRKELSSISHILKTEELSQELIATALLEKAWLARMKFDESVAEKITKFFTKNDDAQIYLITNSNEMDIRATMHYLRSVYPEIKWLDDKELEIAIKVPEKPSVKGISLTKNHKVWLYASYTHRAFKTGKAPESNMTTDKLIDMLIDSEEINVGKTMLISQRQLDRQVAYQRNIAEVYSAEEYFNSLESHYTSRMKTE